MILFLVPFVSLARRLALHVLKCEYELKMIDIVKLLSTTLWRYGDVAACTTQAFLGKPSIVYAFANGGKGYEIT
jgi:prepilin signal peptidase PulO-like enzyme (type II secretory pathway)